MAISVREQVRATDEGEDELEWTEQGWVEKVSHPAHGNWVPQLIARLLALGVPVGLLYDNTRLTPERQRPAGKPLRYVPDLMVVRPSNPVPIEPEADYPGAPDLAIEVVSPGAANEARDRDEKVRNYARRGIPHYWIADPATGLVTWLRLEEDGYVEQWTRPLAAVALPW
jgi:Uma2 family endonuclease